MDNAVFSPRPSMSASPPVYGWSGTEVTLTVRRFSPVIVPEREQSHLRMTRDFLHRLLLSVARDDADADRIEPRTAVRAACIAHDMSAWAPEPFVAPGDGELLLEWDLGNDRSVEIYIGNGEGAPNVAVMAQGEDVREVPLPSLSGLAVLLAPDEALVAPDRDLALR